MPQLYDSLNDGILFDDDPGLVYLTEPTVKKGAIYLGTAGSEIFLTPYGRTYREKTVEISREERTADGTLRKDIIAVKKEFTISYSEIDGGELFMIETLYDLQSELNLIVYIRDDEALSYTVFMDPLDKERILLLGEGLWGNVTIVLKEV